MMENNAPVQLEDAVDRRRLGPGQLLREGRERKQLSVRAVADALHLSTDVVEGLEEERFEDLPPLTFVKGYLRAYAGLVEVPPETVMAAFESLGVDEEERVPSPVPDTQVAASGHPSALFWMVLVVLLAAAAFAAWWLRAPAPITDNAPAEQAGTAAGSANAPERPEVGADSGVDSGAPTPAAGAETMAQPTKDAPAAAHPDAGGASAKTGGPKGNAPTEAVQPQASDTPAAGDTQGETGPETQLAAADDGAPAQDSASAERSGAADALTLTVSGESWIEVRDADGKRLLYGLIQGPVSRHVAGQPPFSLVIGDADRVQLVYQGEDVPLQQFTKGNVARFQWPPDH